MYYVNQEQIDARLRFMPTVAEALRQLAAWNEEPSLLVSLAEERALQLAIEAVTDVGSLLIDGFMMRDASSYEDIIDVLHIEGVLPEDEAAGLRALIALRRPLMQEYMDWKRGALRDDLARTADLLDRFPPLVESFIRKELQPFA
ncbi:DUF86 domain-containing protein [Paenibacillus sp.]|uniref:DUF86 domain-containing protein n=1 Tax=Paenibacillus sp. TaxID=58172 RepID=UPI002D4C22B8|nr:HepT-like ribonuclease domain-containing protein [Paenibacillus sp.]HZG87151.1 HepT-like ribonuclease domain-containing protein [Paenibacillus sp.]